MGMSAIIWRISIFSRKFGWEARDTYFILENGPNFDKINVIAFPVWHFWFTWISKNSFKQDSASGVLGNEKKESNNVGNVKIMSWQSPSIIKVKTTITCNV